MNEELEQQHGRAQRVEIDKLRGEVHEFIEEAKVGVRRGLWAARQAGFRFLRLREIFKGRFEWWARQAYGAVVAYRTIQQWMQYARIWELANEAQRLRLEAAISHSEYMEIGREIMGTLPCPNETGKPKVIGPELRLLNYGERNAIFFSRLDPNTVAAETRNRLREVNLPYAAWLWPEKFNGGAK